MPEGVLQFDADGVAVDGRLSVGRRSIDLRQAGLVAVLVHRADLAPRAPVTDDAIVRRRALAGRWVMRWWRRAAVLVSLRTAWSALIVYEVAEGSLIVAVLAAAGIGVSLASGATWFVKGAGRGL